MYNGFQGGRGLALQRKLSQILLVAALLAAGTNTWAQSRPIALPTSPDSGDEPILTWQASTSRRVRIVPKIRHSVPEVTMNVWRQLTCTLPPSYSEIADVETLLTEISRYARIPIEVQISRETLNEIGSIDCCSWSDEHWFGQLREELAQHDIEVFTHPPGLIVRAADHKRSSDWDEPEFPDAIQVIYEISELPMGSKYLLELIHNLVHPNTWDENGGEGSCEIVKTVDGRYLVVLHHEAIQASVLGLLETLAIMCVEPTNVQRLQLSSSIRVGLIRSAMPAHFQETVSILELPTPEHLRKPLPLQGLAEYLQLHGMAVHHDVANVVELQHKQSVVIELRRNHGNFYNDLNHTLSKYGISLSVRKDRIDFVITGNREPEHELAIYDSTFLRVSDEAMRTVLQVIVAPDQWAENGGAGELVVATVGARQMVAVCQPPHLQWQIRRFLEGLAEFVDQTDPVKNRWVPQFKPIGLTATQVRATGSSRAIPLPNSTVPRLTEPDEVSVDSWPVHELQANLWTRDDRHDDAHQYPIFYDITELEVEDEVVYQLLEELVGPEWWEVNGGIATNLIERFGTRRVLITRTTSPHQYAIARFLERLTQTLRSTPIRSNWRMEWVPEPIRVAVQSAGLDAVVVEVLELPSSELDLEAIRQSIMETIEPATWSENGGEYELLFTRINQRQLLVVYHQRRVHQMIRQYLLDRR